MEIARFFNRLYTLKGRENLSRYLGTAFSAAPNGSLLTCRHVVDVRLESDEVIVVNDPQADRFVRIEDMRFSADENLDLAYLPNALRRDKPEFFPVLEPSELTIGEDVYSFGFFSIGGSLENIEQGYFGGRIVSFSEPEGFAELTLPYAVIEGMSGSPVLTYHNGPKLVGVAFGNRSSRILANEVMEVDDNGQRFTETVNRVVEFGRAYHPCTLVAFLTEVRAEGYLISRDTVNVPGL